MTPVSSNAPTMKEARHQVHARILPNGRTALYMTLPGNRVGGRFSDFVMLSLAIF